MTVPSTPNIESYPKMRIVTAISKDLEAVVTLTQPSQYVVNQWIRFKIPQGWGMPQINDQLAIVTAVNDASNQITVNIDTRNYFDFVYPAGGFLAGNGAIAQVVPVGDAKGELAFPFDNLGLNPVIP